MNIKREASDMIKYYEGENHETDSAAGLYFIQNIYVMVIHMTYWLLALTSVQLSNDYLTGYFISGFVDLPPALISVFLFCFALLIAEMIPTSESFGDRTPLLILAILSVIAAFLILTVPETKGKRMPEDANEFDAGWFLAWLGYR
ncbi:unnamed protein product [Dracunculus medinensis]|uniref:Aa_trans domain-containing protein n=1 Tax=Dracunculus medinensis TaxID=318479 RepID=A0A0N4UA59_DRAME|nr:unnamed protein product [Dracunculus medinensis]